MNYTFIALRPTSQEFKGLEVFKAPAQTYRVTLASDEITSLCPITGQPDWYVLKASYVVCGWCLESKSFKLYLHSLRNLGVFCEELANILALELANVLKSSKVVVKLCQKPRGGISITARASHLIEEDES